MIATHVAKLLRERMAELLQHDDVISLNERLARLAPKLAESLSQALSPIQQLKVYRLLLREQVSLRDILTIGTTLLDCSENSKDPVLLAADVRCALRQAIVQAICGDVPQLKVMTLTPELERQLMSALSTAQQQGSVSLDGFPVDPQLLAQLQQKMPQLLAEAKPPDIILSYWCRLSCARCWAVMLWPFQEVLMCCLTMRFLKTKTLWSPVSWDKRALSARSKSL